MDRKCMWLCLVSVSMSVSLTLTEALSELPTKEFMQDDYVPLQETVKNILQEINAAEYEKNVHLREHYDFLIVGASPAGCVLANRLSENPNHTVLLIEAGKPENPFVTGVPMSAPNLQSSSYNWGYATEVQQKACLSMRDKRCNWPHGRGLGGSTIINYMIYTRGNRRDFDRWAEAGNLGWSYNDVLPYFQKFERSVIDAQFPDDTLGKSGLLQIEHSRFRTPIADAFVQSAILANYSHINYNGAEQIGVSYLQASSRNGWRQSAARAFLSNVKNRKNLHISTKSWTSSILFDDERKTVNGVKFFRNKKEFMVKARKEVILSAGVFETPKLLMLSGIGPKKDLEKLNIEVIKDLPVGETLYEHMAVFGPIFTLHNLTDGLVNIMDVINIKPIINFFKGRGPLTSTGIESLLYMKTNNSVSSDPGYPDIELLQSMATVAFDTAEGTRHGIRLSDEAYNNVFKPIGNQRAFQILPMLLHPRSKGYLKLKTRNPFQHPLLYPNFFEDEQDIETLLEGIREAIRIVSQAPLQRLGARLYNVTVPGCEHTVFNSDSYWRCYIRHLSATLHHQVGTCKMGPKSDKTSVVDATGRVHGIRNLRIADTSIIPEPPSGHTAAFSFMIGEKVADMIKTDWKMEFQTLAIRNIIRRKRFDWQKGDPQRKRKLLHLKTRPEEYTTEHLFNVSLQIEEEFLQEAIGDVGLILWGHMTARNDKSFQETTVKPKSRSHVGNSTAVPMDSVTTETTKNIEMNSNTKNISRIIASDEDENRPSHPVKNNSTLPSGMEKIMATMPAVDEDMIRTYTLKLNDRYGRGHAKPKFITKELSKMSFSKYNESDEAVVNTTTTTTRPIQYSTEIMKMHVETSISVETSKKVENQKNSDTISESENIDEIH